MDVDAASDVCLEAHDRAFKNDACIVIIILHGDRGADAQCPRVSGICTDLGHCCVGHTNHAASDPRCVRARRHVHHERAVRHRKRILHRERRHVNRVVPVSIRIAHVHRVPWIRRHAVVVVPAHADRVQVVVDVVRARVPRVHVKAARHGRLQPAHRARDVDASGVGVADQEGPRHVVPDGLRQIRVPPQLHDLARSRLDDAAADSRAIACMHDDGSTSDRVFLCQSEVVVHLNVHRRHAVLVTRVRRRPRVSRSPVCVVIMTSDIALVCAADAAMDVDAASDARLEAHDRALNDNAGVVVVVLHRDRGKDAQ